MTTATFRLTAGPAHRWRIAIYAAAVVTPTLLRALPAPPLLRHLLYAALVLGSAALACRADPGMSRRLRWREWTADVARIATVVAGLVLLSFVQLPAGAIAPRALLLVPAILVPAIVEESVFRALLPRLVTRRAAPAFSSVAFALAHLVLPLGPWALADLVAHGAAGFAFFALRSRDGGLAAPIVAHAAYNAGVLIALE